MSVIKTPAEIEIIRQGGSKLAAVLLELEKMIVPGAKTSDIDTKAEELVVAAGGRPAFKGYGSPPFPGTICACVNEEVVHGIPAPDKVLQDGDLFTIDIGMQYPAKDGLYTDMARTFAVGNVSDEAKNLMRVTKESLMLVQDYLKPGVDLQDVSRAIQEHVESNGYGVVRDLIGHGVGHEVHEDPQVPNFVIPNYHLELKEGMVLAFEPMVTLGSYDVHTAEDLWTVVTKDGKLAAHFEHTFVVTADGNEILTQ